MSETLYRKYRPKTFGEVTDQDGVKLTLIQEIISGQIAHAFLFSGPRGVGKTTMARLVAKAVNCEKRSSADPCNLCPACLEIEQGRSLDIIEIDAASQTGVDQVRDNIIANAKVATAIRKFKVFIIDEVHMLSTAAFNALLKTLEEPPARVIFILATTEIHKVPATIISRCQRFDFKKIRLDTLKERLKLICGQEGFEVEDRVLTEIAKHSQGYLRDALSLLGQILSLGSKKIDLEQASLILPISNLDHVWTLTRHLAKKETEAGLRLIDELSGQGIDLFQFANEWVEFLRIVMIAKTSNEWSGLSNYWNQEACEIVKSELNQWGANDALRLIELILKHKASIKTTEIPSLPLELVVISYCNF